MRQIDLLKRTVKAIIGKEVVPKLDGRYTHQRFGSRYGGWNVIVDRLNPASIVYSFGIGEDATFDLALINQFGVTIHAFDPTPRSIEWVRQQKFPSQFVLHKYGLAHFDGTANFYQPANPKHISHTIVEESKMSQDIITVPVKRLETILQELGHDHIDLLKADIEGAEYQFLDDLEAGPIRPDQLLLEFHHRFPGIGLNKTKQAIIQLREMGYQLFFLSDSGRELCFVQPR